MLVSSHPGVIYSGFPPPIQEGEGSLRRLPSQQNTLDLCLLTLTQIGLTKALKYLQNYCSSWELAINPNKSKILICNKGSKNARSERWSIQNEALEIVNKFTYLGYTFNNKGSTTDHINKMKHKGKQAMSLLYSIQSKIPNVNHKLLKRIYLSTIEPRFTYAIELFFHSTPSINTINQFRAKLCKRILYLPRNSSNTASRHELGIDSAHVIAMTRACKF